MRKIWALVALILIVGGCLKKPAPPDWKVRINIPAIDTTATMEDLAKNEDKVYISADTVFYGEDTTVYNKHVQGTVPWLSARFSHHLPSDIDTANSNIQSFIYRIYYGIRLTGSMDSPVTGKIIIQLFTKDTTRSDTDFINIPQGPITDSLILYTYNDFPIGDFTIGITIDTFSGSGFINSANVFYKIPFNARIIGDTVVSVLKKLNVPSDVQDAQKNNQIDSLILHLDVWNRLPVGFKFGAEMWNADTTKEYTIFDSVNIQLPPITQGMTNGPETHAVIEIPINDSAFDFFQDSIINLKAWAIFPPISDTIFVNRTDYIRAWGYIQAVIHTKNK